MKRFNLFLILFLLVLPEFCFGALATADKTYLTQHFDVIESGIESAAENSAACSESVATLAGIVEQISGVVSVIKECTFFTFMSCALSWGSLLYLSFIHKK